MNITTLRFIDDLLQEKVNDLEKEYDELLSESRKLSDATQKFLLMPDEIAQSEFYSKVNKLRETLTEAEFRFKCAQDAYADFCSQEWH
jgi:hypothetical protein